MYKSLDFIKETRRKKGAAKPLNHASPPIIYLNTILTKGKESSRLCVSLLISSPLGGKYDWKDPPY